MSDSLTAKFDTLSQAEAAAARLRSIRIEEVGISRWQGAQSERDAEMASNEDLYVPYVPTGGSGFFPSLGGGVSSGGLGMLPFAAAEVYSPGLSQQSYLLSAMVDSDQREMAVRIIRECGGGEI